MLGRRIADPAGIEGPPAVADGLGLLDLETTLGPVKRLAAVAGTEVQSGEPVAGYEMHMGRTSGRGAERGRCWRSAGGRRGRCRRTGG